MKEFSVLSSITSFAKQLPNCGINISLVRVTNSDVRRCTYCTPWLFGTDVSPDVGRDS